MNISIIFICFYSSSSNQQHVWGFRGGGVFGSPVLTHTASFICLQRGQDSVELFYLLDLSAVPIDLLITPAMN